jgi:hypothetical protein
MRYLLAATIVVGGLAGPVLGQGTFPLEFRESKMEETPALGETYCSCSRSAGKPDAVGSVPGNLPEQITYFRFGPEDAATWLLATSGTKPVLYVDSDRDGNLAEETPASGTRDQSGITFAGASVPGTDGRSVRVRMISHTRPATRAPVCLHAAVAGFRTGQVRLGGKAYRVAVIDGDLSGRYNDIPARPLTDRRVDAVVIDRNGNGQFERFDPTGNSPPEWSPLTKALAVDGAWYAVTVAADGSTIDLSPTQPAYGHLDLGPHRLTLGAFSDFGYQRIESRGGKVRVPAGRYATVSLELLKSDGTANWRLQLARDAGRLATFVVEAGQTFSIPLGPPLVPAASVELAGGTVRLDYRLAGRSGERYAPAVMKGNSRVAPPQVEIVDTTGKVIYSGKFAYG